MSTKPAALVTVTKTTRVSLTEDGVLEAIRRYARDMLEDPEGRTPNLADLQVTLCCDGDADSATAEVTLVEVVQP